MNTSSQRGPGPGVWELEGRAVPQGHLCVTGVCCRETTTQHPSVRGRKVNTASLNFDDLKLRRNFSILFLRSILYFRGSILCLFSNHEAFPQPVTYRKPFSKLPLEHSPVSVLVLSSSAKWMLEELNHMALNLKSALPKRVQRSLKLQVIKPPGSCEQQNVWPQLRRWSISQKAGAAGSSAWRPGL